MTVQVVLDASAALDLLIPTERGERIVGFLLGVEADLQVPPHFRIECTHALRSMLLRGVVGEDRAAACHQDLLDLRCTVWSDGVLLDRTWGLRHSMTAYDAAYLALAEILEATLVTSDRRFARAAHALGRAPITVF